ncbi:MAG: hypothetical protein ACJ8HI_22315 [Massilia sp.]
MFGGQAGQQGQADEEAKGDVANRGEDADHNDINPAEDNFRLEQINSKHGKFPEQYTIANTGQ